jgi:hypothetical protein
VDYSKKDGGTRQHDQLKLRTLATGIGQTETGARHSGSHRAERVVAGMKPGQLVHDPGLKQQHDQMDKQRQMLASMHMDGPPDPADKFPLESGSTSHHQAGTIAPPAATHNDQGEQVRRPVTGRSARPSMQISPTVK